MVGCGRRGRHNPGELHRAAATAREPSAEIVLNSSLEVPGARTFSAAVLRCRRGRQ
jgi:hypothetical protein